MEVALSNITDIEKEIQIQVTAKELVPHFEDAYKREQSKLEVRGFRKGKAPLDLIKRIYGESIEYDALSQIASDFYRKYAEEEHLEPLGEPVLADINYKRGEELTFKIKFEVKPKFELGNYKGIQLERVIYPITEKDVENELRRLQKSNSTRSEAQSATDDEHILAVDVQELDHAGTPLIGKKNLDMRVYLADESVHPEVRLALLGVSTGESRRIKYEIERDGQKTQHHIECTVKKIEKVQLPDFDDEFVKKVTKKKVSTLTEFRKRIQSDLEAYWRDASERNMVDTLIGEIVRQHDFTVPESLIKAVADSYIEELKSQYPNKKFPADFDEKQFRDEYRPSAIFQAKWYIVRERIAEAEKIAVEEADIQRRAERDAPNMGIDKERLLQFYQTSDSVKEKITSEKLMTFLKDHAIITEKISKESTT